MAQEKQNEMVNLEPEPIWRLSEPKYIPNLKEHITFINKSGTESGNIGESSENLSDPMQGTGQKTKEEQLAMVSQKPSKPRVGPRAAATKYLPELEQTHIGTGSGNVGESREIFHDPIHGSGQKAKENQLAVVNQELAMVKQEPVIMSVPKFSGSKYKPYLEPTYLTNKGGIGSGYVGESSNGFGAPNHGIGQKAKVWEMTKPDSWSEIEIPGLWPSSFSDEHCCIYRVPNRLRRVNPEAYTPQMLLIGPLHHSKKAQALELSKTDSRYVDYINMEIHKEKYLNEITNMYGEQMINGHFIKIIEADEKFIRENYSESTDWIKTPEFVKMMLLDSIFILKFLMRVGNQNINKKGDILFEEPCLVTTILEDLMLLENQIPYTLLTRLFEPFFKVLEYTETFRDLTLRAFGFEGKVKEEVRFRHFTDLFRRVRLETLGLTQEQIKKLETETPKSIKSLHNADKLDSAGVDFVNVDEENDLSLVINFQGGILKMPCFIAEDNTERVIRNLMALEQCRYPLYAYVCNYIAFLDFLIDTEQDVDLLVKKGVVKNWLGHQGSVAEMVNKLCLGLVDFGSRYYDIAESLNNHYDNGLNRSVATLRRVYFKDLWTGTATIAAVIILILTLIGTVASVLQLMPKDNNSPPSPPPARGP